MFVETITEPLHVLSLTLAGVSPASGTVEVQTDLVPDGEQWTIDYIAFEDEDNSATAGRIYTDGVFGRQYWRQWTTLSAATIYAELRQSVHLAPGEVVGVRVTGATSGDIVRVYLRGHRILGA